MKTLTEVTLKDAIAILSASLYYENFFKEGKWKLVDVSAEAEEPCTLMVGQGKQVKFWFLEDSIDMELVVKSEQDEEDEVFYDVNYPCYVKAVSLGYHVPVLSEFIDEVVKNVMPKEEPVKKEKSAKKKTAPKKVAEKVEEKSTPKKVEEKSEKPKASPKVKASPKPSVKKTTAMIVKKGIGKSNPKN